MCVFFYAAPSIPIIWQQVWRSTYCSFPQCLIFISHISYNTKNANKASDLFRTKGLRWWGFKGFDRTYQFLKKGSVTCQFLAIKSKNLVFREWWELREYLKKVLKKIWTPQFKIPARPFIPTVYTILGRVWRTSLRTLLLWNNNDNFYRISVYSM